MTSSASLAALHAAFQATLKGATAPEPTQFDGGATKPARLDQDILPPVLDA